MKCNDCKYYQSLMYNDKLFCDVTLHNINNQTSSLFNNAIEFEEKGCCLHHKEAEKLHKLSDKKFNQYVQQLEQKYKNLKNCSNKLHKNKVIKFMNEKFINELIKDVEYILETNYIISSAVASENVHKCSFEIFKTGNIIKNKLKEVLENKKGYKS